MAQWLANTWHVIASGGVIMWIDARKGLCAIGFPLLQATSSPRIPRYLVTRANSAALFQPVTRRLRIRNIWFRLVLLTDGISPGCAPIMSSGKKSPHSKRESSQLCCA